MHARPWLPANATKDGVLTRALTDVAELWAARWFSAPKPISVRMSEAARQSLPSESTRWVSPGGGILLALSPSAHTPIGCALLNLETGAQKLSSNDHSLLQRLSHKCVEDFANDVARLFGTAPLARLDQREQLSGLRFSYTLGAASQLLDLFVDESHAISARRSLITTATITGAARPLRSRKEAIAQQKIRVGAMIGSSQLGLGDLRTLQCGDVLVLDRGPADRLNVAIDGAARRETACTITRDGGELLMRLEATESS